MTKRRRGSYSICSIPSKATRPVQMSSGDEGTGRAGDTGGADVGIQPSPLGLGTRFCCLSLRFVAPQGIAGIHKGTRG